MTEYEKICEAAEAIRACCAALPSIGLILGSVGIALLVYVFFLAAPVE